MEYLFALVYHLTGEQFWVARFLTWCMFIAGVIGLYLWVKEWLHNPTIAYYTSIIFLFIPELFFHCINPLPDILALSSSIWGLYFYQKFQQNKTWQDILICTLFTTLAGLTKIQYLAIGFFMVSIFFLSLKTYTHKDILKLSILGIFSTISSLTWYWYARYLIRKSGLYDFGIEFRPARDFNLVVEILQKNIISDLPELLLGFSSFVLFIFGLIHIRAVSVHKKYFIPLLVWSIVLLLYHFVELGQ
ncbi:MAG: glycosyltransferase family 39 protein [Bacteroidia bacterium]|nr:glycosyltransferase family 39 protein [Bacteroidia bacterium]